MINVGEHHNRRCKVQKLSKVSPDPELGDMMYQAGKFTVSTKPLKNRKVVITGVFLGHVDKKRRLVDVQYQGFASVNPTPEVMKILKPV